VPTAPVHAHPYVGRVELGRNLGRPTGRDGRPSAVPGLAARRAPVGDTVGSTKRARRPCAAARRQARPSITARRPQASRRPASRRARGGIGQRRGGPPRPAASIKVSAVRAIPDRSAAGQVVHTGDGAASLAVLIPGRSDQESGPRRSHRVPHRRHREQVVHGVTRVQCTSGMSSARTLSPACLAMHTGQWRPAWNASTTGVNLDPVKGGAHTTSPTRTGAVQRRADSGSPGRPTRPDSGSRPGRCEGTARPPTTLIAGAPPARRRRPRGLPPTLRHKELSIAHSTGRWEPVPRTLGELAHHRRNRCAHRSPRHRSPRTVESRTSQCPGGHVEGQGSGILHREVDLADPSNLLGYSATPRERSSGSDRTPAATSALHTGLRCGPGGGDPPMEAARCTQSRRSVDVLDEEPAMWMPTGPDRRRTETAQREARDGEAV